MKNILETRGLEGFYRIAQVLHGLDLRVPESGVTAILGANGAGKTSLLRAICGMIRVKGSVVFQGRQLVGLATEEIARAGIAHVPEGRGTFIDLSVEENLRLGAVTRPDRKAVARDLELIYDLFPILNNRKKQRAGTLSGGEQQMLAISRALMLRPRLMLLDEPSIGLAPLIVEELFKVLQRIKREQGISLLINEQNASLALEIADLVYVMEGGRIVLEDTPSNLRKNDSIQKAYLGM